MKKEYMLAIGIVIIVLLIIGAFLFVKSDDLFANNSSIDNSSQFQLGSYAFSLPDGYNVKNTTNGSVKISNGYNTIEMLCHDNKNVKKFVNNYISKKENESKQVNLTNFTVKKTVVYKTTLSNDTGIVHYWFKKDNSTYTMYSMDANKNTDKVITQLIKSMNKVQ